MHSLKDSLKEKIVFLKLKSGDAEAFGYFYDKYVKQIYRYIYIKVSSQQVAEDLTQDVFLKTWQHLVDQKNVTHFKAFIFRIAHNTVVDHYRRSNTSTLPLEDLADPAVEEVVQEKLEISLDTETLLKYLQQLKTEYQEILILRFVEDLSINEIAEVMQKDRNNVRVTLHRAINKLKQLVTNNINKI